EDPSGPATADEYARPPARSAPPRPRTARSALLRLPPLEELAPVGRRHLDAVLRGGRLDAFPCPVTLGVAGALDLIEAGDRAAHVGGVGQRLLALVGEGESAVGKPVLLR